MLLYGETSVNTSIFVRCWLKTTVNTVLFVIRSKKYRKYRDFGFRIHGTTIITRIITITITTTTITTIITTKITTTLIITRTTKTTITTTRITTTLITTRTTTITTFFLRFLSCCPTFRVPPLKFYNYEELFNLGLIEFDLGFEF